jgi:glycosyltransferase involved in cell wall biosynthesis
MLSVVVCTRDRVDLLEGCLRALTTQTDHPVPYEIVVVDNGSKDGTRTLVEELTRTNAVVRYVSEPRVGLSRARNAGARAAAYPYVAYIDDDGRVGQDFVRIVARVIEEFDFDCFGGWFVPWYRTPKPKWLPDTFGYYRKWLDRTGILERGKDLPGGILIIKKDALQLCGGFPEELGMRGAVIGYGEENVVQQRLRKLKKTIGFCPDLVLSHLVAEYKFSVGWHLKRQFALARDRRALRGQLSTAEVAVALVKAVSLPLPLLCYNSRKFFQNKPYYWQNWLLDSLKGPLRALGSASASASSKRRMRPGKAPRQIGSEIV